MGIEPTQAFLPILSFCWKPVPTDCLAGQVKPWANSGSCTDTDREVICSMVRNREFEGNNLRVKLHGMNNSSTAFPVLTPSPSAQDTGTLLSSYNRGQFAEAIAAAESMTKQFPDHKLGWEVLGAALRAVGQHEDALSPKQKVIALFPNEAAGFFNLGNSLIDLGRSVPAANSFRRAIQLKPLFAEAHGHLGDALQALQQNEDAETSCRISIEIKPDCAESYNYLGNTLRMQGKLFEARLCYDRAITLERDFPKAHCNRGVVLYDLGQFDCALESFERAIEISPHYAEANWNKSLALLLGGDLGHGWELYEWRQKGKNVDTTGFEKPLWLGKDSISGKTILLRNEQGLGDFIQFCRYVPMVESLGARVILETPEPLLTTISTLKGNFNILRVGDPAPYFDFQCPIMSLPFAFGTTLSTIPCSNPYLFADPRKVDLWNKVLGEKTRLRVGLVWSGGFRPNRPDLWAVNERRNIKLSMLSSFKSLNVEFYSLQKGQPAESELAEQRKSCWSGPDIQDFTSELKDFSDTAALIANLDLVISVDTSTAHLAAALGKEVWILNRRDTCWRWLLDRSDSPWYPTVTLIRQPTVGDWHSVISLVHVKLAERQHRK